MVAAAVGIGTAVAGVAGSAIQAGSASDAASQQAGATQSQIAQQNYEFNTVRGLLQPYVDAGSNGPNNALGNYNNAATGYGNVLGLLNNYTGANGPGAQQAAFSGLTSNPLYTTSMQLGQQAILANASATGGLRNGNTIANLGYLPNQVLTNVLGTQMGALGTSLNGIQSLAGLYGNLVNVGENAAAGTGQAAMNTGNNITSLIGQQGAIGAGATLAGGNAFSNSINGISGALGQYLNNAPSTGGTYGFSVPGATSSMSTPYYLNAAGLTGPNGISVAAGGG